MNIPRITVTKDDADTFYLSIENALLHRPPARKHIEPNLIDYDYKTLFISFDSEYRAFIGYTKGYNEPVKREYLSPSCSLVNQLADQIEAYGDAIPGGRAHITRVQAYLCRPDRVDAGWGLSYLKDFNILLCTFNWQGDDIWIRCRDLLRRLRSQA